MTRQSTGKKQIGMVQRILMSALCTFGGWCVLSACVFLHFYFLHRSNAENTKALYTRMGMESWQPQRPSWLLTPTAITTFSWPYVAAIWLILVLPLFVAIKPDSWLWKWPIATLGFGTVGALIMFGAIRFQLAPMADTFVQIAALTGAATGLFCSIAKRTHYRKKMAEPCSAGLL